MAPTPLWSQQDIFPIISKHIYRLYREQEVFVTHDAITSALLQDLESRRIIDGVKQKRPEKDQFDIAANMVAWFSQRITEGYGTYYEQQFERTIVDKRYAYRPRKPPVT